MIFFFESRPSFKFLVPPVIYIRYGHKALANYWQLKVVKNHKASRVYLKYWNLGNLKASWGSVGLLTSNHCRANNLNKYVFQTYQQAMSWFKFVLIKQINAFIFGVIVYHSLYRLYNISLLNIWAGCLWLLLLLLYLLIQIKRID